MKIYYKFIKLEYAEKYFNNECLRLTQAKDLNDPFECIPKKYISKSFLNRFLNRVRLDTYLKSSSNSAILIENQIKAVINDIKNNTENNLLDIFMNGHYQDVNEQVGILSLSETWNNTLMWSHYADSHKGICIGFDSQHSFFKDYVKNEEYKLIEKVIYSKNRVKLPMRRRQEKLILKNYFTKSVDWKYEKEIRIISPINLAIKDNQNENVYLINVPHSAVSEIIIGNKVLPENEIEIRKFCEKNRIDFVYKSLISEMKFDMERKKYCW